MGRCIVNFTFVIGNGFDINLGLKTKYTDFYEYIIKNNLSEDNIFFERIQKDIKYWEDFEKMLGIMTCFDNDAFIFTEKINNCKFNIRNDEIDDIVNHILGDENEEIFWEKYNKDLKNFYIEFRKYLESEENRVKISEKENSKRIINSLLYFWKDFEEEEQNLFFKKLDLSIDTQNTDWRRRNKPESEEFFKFTFNFLNFNYSSTLESMLDSLNLKQLETEWSNLVELKLKKKVDFVINFNHYHVHANKNSGMFLGVDNEFQLNNEFFPNIDMMDTIIKPYKIDDYTDGNVSNYTNILRFSDYIYIFGMSIGVTDLTWWKICVELIQRHSVKIVIHYFENNFRIDISDPDYKVNKDKVREMLLRYDDTFEELIDRVLRRKIKNGIIPVANSQIMFKTI